jgi:Ca2+-binding EF-hand superfamily protein
LCAGNGYITTNVLREILKELDDKLTAEDLDLMIEEIDSDGSGTVDFDGKLSARENAPDNTSKRNTTRELAL